MTAKKTYLSSRVWIIALDNDSRRYTPAYCHRNEAKNLTSKKVYENFHDCLKECQTMNAKADFFKTSY
jgi:hypothetical protein